MAELKKYLDQTALGTLVDQIKAEDAKVLAAATKAAEDLGKNYDVAGAAATALSDAKAYTDTLANGAVKANTEAIAKLNGDATTEGSVAKAVEDARAALQALIDATDAIADKNAEDIAAINNANTGILAQAKAYTDTEVAGVQSEVNELESYVGTFTSDNAKNVVEYIDEKTSGIALDADLGALTDRVTQAEKDIDAIEADYLRQADKTELEGKITDAQTAADGAQSYAEGVAGDLANEVKAREDADSALDGRIASLEGTIVGLSGAMHFEGVKNEVPTDVTGYEQGDVIIVGNKEYVLNGDAFVEFGDASVNAEAITALTGRVDTAEGKITAAEGKITALEGAVATKAEQTYVDEAVEALEGADEALSGRIAALEAKHGDGEGTVESLIAAARQEAIDAAASAADAKDVVVLADAKAYTDTEVGKDRTRLDALEAATHTHGNLALLETYTQTEADLADAVAKKHQHSNFDVLEAITAAKVAAWDASEQAAKTYADGLNTAMQETVDGIDERVEALEGAIVLKAAASDLEAAVARIAKNETDIAANTSAINSFTPITSEEVNAMFA